MCLQERENQKFLYHRWQEQMMRKKFLLAIFLFLLHFWPCLEAMLPTIRVCDTFMELSKPVKSRRSAVGCLLCQAALTACVVWCHNPLLKYPMSAGEFSHLWLLTRATYWENTGNLVWGNLQKPSQGPDMHLRNLFLKFSYATMMHKIYLQVIQIPELSKLFVPWHRWNQLQLFQTAFIGSSNISWEHFLWNLIDVMPRRKFAL